jgi:molecular chaperone HtpG
MISLKEYVFHMKEGQKDIYFITGESKQADGNLPFIESLKKKGIEVIYIIDFIDEYVIQLLKDCGGKKLRNCTKEGMEMEENEDDKKKFEEQKKDYETLCKQIREILGDKVENVILSNRIQDSPYILITSEHCWSAIMERIM